MVSAVRQACAVLMVWCLHSAFGGTGASLVSPSLPIEIPAAPGTTYHVSTPTPRPLTTRHTTRKIYTTTKHITTPPRPLTTTTDLFTTTTQATTTTVLTTTPQRAFWEDELLLNVSNHFKYACAGDTVNIPWNFQLGRKTESVVDIKWYYGDSLMAIFADHEFVVLPTFRGDVAQFNNAGLVLRNVRPEDTGDYSVMVSLHDNSTGDDSYYELKKSVVLQVGNTDSLMTLDGKLHVSENPVAVKNPGTQRWGVELLCGNFTYRALPPFQVQWHLPDSENIRPSNSFIDNHFRLLLEQPVEGNFTCRIPAQDMRSACLLSNETAKAQATWMMHRTPAYLKILESENTELKNTVSRVNSSCLPGP